ncbi:MULTISPECIES: MAPEG family protein [Rhizobium]|uniref:MAPEG family protein n=1 Tax=Rhizobium TaxID=379 RepID=UPI00195F138B|nr:MAPEG family protein [Rhizobium lusitanum]MBM7045001.1 MAPEG family protein [Rhizobium lusitanum]
MTGYEMFWPMVAHAVLVFILYALLGWRRRVLVNDGRIKPSQFRENHAADEPAESLVVRNNIANQFELPLLFHACCIVLYVTQADNLPAVILAWLFVATRYAHAFVHVTSNSLRYRSPLFAMGYVVLAGMWVWLGVWLAFS